MKLQVGRKQGAGNGPGPAELYLNNIIWENRLKLRVTVFL